MTGMQRQRISGLYLKSKVQKNSGQGLLLAVLVLILIALFGAAFVAVIATNIESAGRFSDKEEARIAAEKARDLANDQLVKSDLGLDWKPQTGANYAHNLAILGPNDPPTEYTSAGVQPDPAFAGYYDSFEQLRGFTSLFDNSFFPGRWVRRIVKFPDPSLFEASETPTFLLEVNYPSFISGIPRPLLAINAIGRSRSNTATFSEIRVFKPVALFENLRFVTAHDYARRTVPSTSLVVPVAAGGNTILVDPAPGFEVPAVQRTYISSGKYLAIYDTAAASPNGEARMIMAVNDGEPYTDSNGNGIYNGGEPYTDLNGNGVFDANILTIVLDAPLSINHRAGERVEVCNSLGVPTADDFNGTGVEDGHGGAIVGQEHYVTNWNALPASRGNGSRVNGSMLLQGLNSFHLMAPGGIETGSIVASGIHLFGELTPLGPLDPLHPTVTEISSPVRGAPAGTPIPAVDSNNPAFPGPAAAGLLQDGFARLQSRAMPNREIQPLTPPDLTVEDPRGAVRYRTLTRDSRATVGVFGYGEGIYISNPGDIEKKTVVIGGVPTAVPLTLDEEKDLWMRRPLSSTGADLSFEAAALYPAPNPLQGTPVQQGTLEERHIRGWINDNTFLPRGVRITLVANAPTTWNALTNTFNVSGNPGIIIDMDERSDARGPGASGAYDPSHQGPDPAKVVRLPDGTPVVGAYRKVIEYSRIGGPGGPVVANFYINGILQAGPLPFNRCVMAEGNICIRGTLEDDPLSINRDISLSIISMGTIYIEGDLRAPFAGRTFLAANRHVTVNPTRFISGPSASTVVTSTLPAVQVGSAEGFHVNDMVLINAEPFIDLNGDGIWNPGEPFSEAPGGNGSRDPAVLRRITTVASGGAGALALDLPPGVAFTAGGPAGPSSIELVNVPALMPRSIRKDALNGSFEPLTAFYDSRQNMFIRYPQTIVPALNVPGEPFTDVNGNGIHDALEPYTDTNGNGVWDSGFVITMKQGGGTMGFGNTDPRNYALSMQYDATDSPPTTMITNKAESAILPNMIDRLIGIGESHYIASTGGLDLELATTTPAQPPLTSPTSPMPCAVDPTGGPYTLQKIANTKNCVPSMTVGGPPPYRSNPGDLFTDTNGNDVWDVGEPLLIDFNGNGMWDGPAGTILGKGLSGIGNVPVGEPYTDVDGNGIHDPGEPFVDLNSNGIYDGATRPIVTMGGASLFWIPLASSVRTFLFQPVFGAPNLTPFPLGPWNTMTAPFGIVGANRTGEPYTDVNANGFYDVGEPFTDLNANGAHDDFEDAATTDESFVRVRDAATNQVFDGSSLLLPPVAPWYMTASQGIGGGIIYNTETRFMQVYDRDPESALGNWDPNAYRYQNVKLEASDLNGNPIQALTVEIHAIVFAQHGSFFVIPGDNFDRSMAVAMAGNPIAPMPPTANTAGQRDIVIDHAVAGQYDLNAAGIQIPVGSWVVVTDTVTGNSDKAFVVATASTGTQTALTLSTNLVNSYAAGTALVDINTDQNRDGVVTPAERASIRRHLRNNYSIAFVGSITENHSATTVYSTHRTLTTVGTALGATAVTVNGIADAIPGGVIIVGGGAAAEERIIAGVQRTYYNTAGPPLTGTRVTTISFTTPLAAIHGPNEPVIIATRGEAREWTDKWLYPTNFAAPVGVGSWNGIRYFYDIGFDPLVGGPQIPPFLPASPDLVESTG